MMEVPSRTPGEPDKSPPRGDAELSTLCLAIRSTECVHFLRGIGGSTSWAKKREECQED